MAERNYCYEATLYDEDPAFPDHIARLRTLCAQDGMQWASAWHPLDLKEDGSKKKPHLHFLVRYPNAVGMSRLSLDTGIPANYIVPKKHLQSAVRYLAHLDHSDTKTLYSADIIEGSLAYWSTEPVKVRSFVSDDSYDRTDDLLACIEIAEAVGLAFGSVADLLRSVAIAGYLKAYKDFSATLMQVYKQSLERARLSRTLEDYEAERKEILERKRLLQEEQCVYERVRALSYPAEPLASYTTVSSDEQLPGGAVCLTT